jgi:hypothetical protein
MGSLRFACGLRSTPASSSSFVDEKHVDSLLLTTPARNPA